MPFDETQFLKKSVNVLSFFNEDQLRRITPDIERSTYQSGQTIVLRGEITSGLYIVKQGKVAANYTGKVGPVKIELKPGDFFGEISLLEDAASDASFKAAENETVVMTIPHESFNKLLAMQPLLKTALFDTIAERRKAIPPPK